MKLLENKIYCSLDDSLSNKSGFSIVETIVAIAILSLAMIAPLSLAQRGINASMYAKDQVTAFYLAQEAIEYVRNVRDNNNLRNLSGGSLWLSGLENCVYPKKCGVDITANPPIIVDCSSNPNLCRVTFNRDQGIYGLQTGGAWQSTIFTRSLQIKRVPVGADLDGEADLVAKVSWISGIISRDITVEEQIFNWFPPPAF